MFISLALCLFSKAKNIYLVSCATMLVGKCFGSRICEKKSTGSSNIMVIKVDELLSNSLPRCLIEMEVSDE